jgi:hypothetical protein
MENSTMPRHRTMRHPKPSSRRLRVFAVDPSLKTELVTAEVNCVEASVPWEDFPPGMPQDIPCNRKYGPAPGPVGEYIEVIDYDPASGLFYEPIDLNHPFLLEQHGLEPSDGNPQFHQQMVYAVSMKTIRSFERALGRPVMWAPLERENGELGFVQRLRLYPHAFRDANAYYLPSKKAILFGYFPATRKPSGRHLPGGIVFSCLSQDIIVHELSHALLDGLHRRFIEDSNPDVLAFHEAFADIIALFQHFTYPEIVKFEIGRNRGDVQISGLLAKLAHQFGRAIGRAEALRSAIGKPPDPQALENTFEPHARGAILVAAVFDAFITIFNARKADLIRIATSGSGLLGESALHPDLVNRLSEEASKAAAHVLNICIRALDYVPPVDITFGDFLRALITADYDLVPDDARNYRVAFIEAFRRRGIYPGGVRSLSEENLIWDSPLKWGLDRSKFTFVDALRNMVADWDIQADRENLFDKLKDAAKETKKIFQQTWTYKSNFVKGLNINGDVHNLEVHSIRPVRRVGPDGDLLTDLLVEITQQRPGFFQKDKAFGSLSTADWDGEQDFWFRGGVTILIDMKTTQVRYCIYKDIDSADRYARQRQYLQTGTPVGRLRTAYFARQGGSAGADRTFAMLHRRKGSEVLP